MLSDADGLGRIGHKRDRQKWFAVASSVVGLVKLVPIHVEDLHCEALRGNCVNLRNCAT